MKKIFTKCVVIICILSCSTLSVSAQAELDLEEIIRGMRAAHSLRSELLLRSQGTAVLKLEKRRDPEVDKALRDKAIRDLGPIAGLMNQVGDFKGSFKWFRKDNLYRTDSFVSDEDAVPGFSEPRDVRKATNKEKLSHMTPNVAVASIVQIPHTATPAP